VEVHSDDEGGAASGAATVDLPAVGLFVLLFAEEDPPEERDAWAPSEEEEEEEEEEVGFVLDR